MADEVKSELEALTEQLHELLDQPIVDAEDALELATVAGGLERLGADPRLLALAEAWRDGEGKELVDELWQQVDAEPLLEAIEVASEGSATDEEVEDSLYDFDDLVVAAIWCRRQKAVKVAAVKAEKLIRALPDAFGPFAEEAKQLVKRREVAMEFDLYGYWFAVAEADPGA